MHSSFSFSSPRHPIVPHPTPVSSKKQYTLSKPPLPRPPVVNPYDKFTQSEFDHWINGITGALRKALGHETDEDTRSAEQVSVSNLFTDSSRKVIPHSTYHVSSQDEDEEEYHSEGDVMNDSLAEIKFRHIARQEKGKARDPREGPGLFSTDKGARDTPIEIDLESEGSEVNEERDGQHRDLVSSLSSPYLDEDELDDDEVAQHLSLVQQSDGEEDDDSIEGQPLESFLRTHRLSDDEDTQQPQDLSDEEDSKDSEEEQEQLSPDHVIDLLSSDDEHQPQIPTQGTRGEKEHDSEGEYESSEAETENGDENDENEDGVDEEILLPPRLQAHIRRHPPFVDEREESGEDEEGDGDEEDGGEEDEDGEDEDGYNIAPQHISGHKDSPGRDIINLDSDDEEVDQLQEEEDAIVQPVEDDTSFPPHTDGTQPRVEIQDPWLGPQTYAQDYYAGGAVLASPGHPGLLNPHHLGINDDGYDFLTPGVITPTESYKDDAGGKPRLGDIQVSNLRSHMEAGTPNDSLDNMDVVSDVAAIGSPVMDSQTHNTLSPDSSEKDKERLNAASVYQTASVERLLKPSAIPAGSDQHRQKMSDVQLAPPVQVIMQDDEDAARLAEAAFDKLCEEIDAEITEVGAKAVEVESYEVTPSVGNQLSSTGEDIEASDVDEVEPESPHVLPLGTSDLGIEPVSDDDRSTPPVQEAGTITVIEVTPMTESGGLGAEQIDSEQEVQTTNVTEMPSPSLGPAEPIGEDPVVIAVPPAVQQVAEADHEQQQLPTPPAEQEVFSHHSQKHTLSLPLNHESGDFIVVHETSQAIAGSSSQVLTESATIAADSKEEELIGNENASTEELTTDPLAPITSLVVDTSVIPPATTDSDNAELAQPAAKATEPVIDQTFKETTPALPVIDKADVSITVEDDHKPSIETTGPFDTLVGSQTYTVIEAAEEEVTDEDADGEADPDLEVQSIYTELGSIVHKADYLVEEVLSESARSTEEPANLFFELLNDDVIDLRPSEANEPAVTHLEEKVSVGIEEGPYMTFVSPSLEEDDIASSREASPDLVYPDFPTRSQSPAINLVVENNSLSEKEIARDVDQTQTEDKLETPADAAANAIYYKDSISLNVPVLDQAHEDAPSPPSAKQNLEVPPETSSPQIPGLGTRPLPEPENYIPTDEIPGLTWSTIAASVQPANIEDTNVLLPRSASCPDVTLSMAQTFSPATSYHLSSLPRRPTHPFLFGDPYPYSLSTPRFETVQNDFLNLVSGSDDAEQEIFMSSVDMEFKDGPEEQRDEGTAIVESEQSGMKDAIPNDPPTIFEEEQEVRATVDSAGQTAEPYESSAADEATFAATTSSQQVSSTVDADHDRDADGDLDPDFVQLTDTEVNSTEKAEVLKVNLAESVSKEPKSEKDVVHDEPQEDQEALTPCSSDNEELVSPRTDNDIPPATYRKDNGVIKKYGRGSRNSKRKRTPSPASPRSSGSVEIELPETVQASLQMEGPSKSKRARKDATNGKVIERNNQVARSAGDEGGLHATSLSPQRHKRKRNSSRSKSPVITPVSPKKQAFDGFHFFDKGPLLHAHGRGGPKPLLAPLHHTQHTLAPTSQSVKKTSSAPTLSRSSDHALSPTELLSVQHPSLTLSQRHSSNSRATRSNCRYRKISVPLGEGRERVCFLVPGCSLSDQEVIEDNEIIDEGEATYADSLRMIKDIESLDFDSYLIGVLRQLVGVDLLREQEVFYLPAIGEEPRLRKSQLRKSASEKISTGKKLHKTSTADSASMQGSPRHSISSAKSRTSSRAPLSSASTSTTSASVLRKVVDLERKSLTPALSADSECTEELSSETDDAGHNHVRELAKTDKDKGQAEAPPGNTSGDSKRRRPLGTDAAAYKPPSDSGVESSDADDNLSPPTLKRKPAITQPKKVEPKSMARRRDSDIREVKRVKRDR
ncbi:hypothetical protein AMATHDRAFT_2368 [Amanita thiersii Skay4041]|uniref:Uncharacterized protein n=1 Tax=Amanita thiersii Skay4041 TaxID=703135 RepID=A0A2A9NPS6_9AGAR|nr:hypothetical protein AMATHDRAFT_2368 [Amanita thiersii Skay4041]